MLAAPSTNLQTIVHVCAATATTALPKIVNRLRSGTRIYIALILSTSEGTYYVITDMSHTNRSYIWLYLVYM